MFEQDVKNLKAWNFDILFLSLKWYYCYKIRCFVNKIQ